jgi:hypothetical protein
MAVRSMETVEMAPGALPPLGRVPEQRLLSPEIWLRQRRSYRTVLEISPTPLGFSVSRLYIGEGASPGGSQGLLTPGGHGQGLGHAPYMWGRPLAPLRVSFNLREASEKNKTSRTGFVQFREYFLCSFSETQNSRKTGNWHCGILSIG